MLKRIGLLIISLVCSLIVSVAALAPSTAVSLGLWEAKQGDVFYVNLDKNMGYLIHPDGTTMSFPVVTGRKRWSYYIGRYYYAATPEYNWEVKKLDVLPDRYTFGPEGKFLRLSQGDKSTSYGVHTHKYADTMLARDVDKRYVSYGCILVSQKIMDIMEETYEINGNLLNVNTYSS